MKAKLTLNNCQQFALFKKGKCLSELYINCHSQMLWECQKGHQWSTTFSHVLYRNQWCPYCCGNMVTIEDLRNRAKLRGFELVSDSYSDRHTHCLWKCLKNGHVWRATLHTFDRAFGCPICGSGTSRSEQEIFEFVKNLFPDAINKKRGLFKYPKRELDIFIPSLNKAIEYDGEYWHSLPGSDKRAKIKTDECALLNISLLRISDKSFNLNKKIWFDNIRLFLEGAN